MTPQRIFVIGASGKLAPYIVQKLGNNGATITLHYNDNKSHIDKLTENMQNLGVKTVKIMADISKIGEAESLLQNAAKTMGGLDALVHLAAVFYKTPLNEISEKEWNDAININLRSAFFIAQTAAKIIPAGGSMTFFSDAAASHPYKDYIPYSISKAGIEAMVKGLAKALPEIRINAIATKMINTDGMNTSATDPNDIANLVKRLCYGEIDSSGKIFSV